MHVDRMPKQMRFGWWDLRRTKTSIGGTVVQNTFLDRVITSAGAPAMDWFRMAQERRGWKRLQAKRWAPEVVTKKRRTEIDAWMPGKPLKMEPQDMEGIVMIRPARSAPSSYRPATSSTGEKQRTWKLKAGTYQDGALVYKCPVCELVVAKGNQLQYHYDEAHSVRDPGLSTKYAYQCKLCKKYFATRDVEKSYICRIKVRERKKMELQVGEWLPIRKGPDLPLHRAGG